MQQPYDAACDFWSVGVVLFILLSGNPPFYHEDNFELFEKIKRCEYSFKAASWRTVSADAKDFVKKLLSLDPRQRLQGPAIFEHPWMSGVKVVEEEESDYLIIEHMRAWNT